jgi:hypothetical protein
MGFNSVFKGLISVQYEFDSEAQPIKFQQLHVQATTLNNITKGISKDK